FRAAPAGCRCAGRRDPQHLHAGARRPAHRLLARPRARDLSGRAGGPVRRRGGRQRRAARQLHAGVLAGAGPAARLRAVAPLVPRGRDHQSHPVSPARFAVLPARFPLAPHTPRPHERDGGAGQPDRRCAVCRGRPTDPGAGRRGGSLNIWNWLAVGGAAVLALAVVAALRRRVRATAPGRRFFRHPTAGPGVFVLTFFVTIAFAAPVVAPYPPYYQIDIEHPNHPPSAQFLLGTDPLSRDVWSRVVYGARVSLGIGAVAMLVAASVGTAVGAVAGYFRRWVDTTLMRLVDVGLAMPRIFVLLMAVALWEHIALWVLVLLIGLTGWFGTSRLVRAEVLSLREREFVAAARALGAGAGRVIFRHVLPNAAAPIIVSAALGIGHMMLLEAGLSFLGMGVPSPTPSWGNMIADGWHKMEIGRA